MVEDVEIPVLLERMNEAIAAGFTVFIKWTCPKCRTRKTSPEPNIFHPLGYTCRDCGTFYAGPRYGFMAVKERDRGAHRGN